MRINALFIALLSGFLILSCGKFEGDFALKAPLEDVFRKPSGPLEFESSAETTWAYIFRSSFPRSDINIITMKKEITWVTTSSYNDYAGGGKSMVGGTISGYEPGEYRLVLMDSKGAVIDEITFTVYTEEE